VQELSSLGLRLAIFGADLGFPKSSPVPASHQHTLPIIYYSADRHATAAVKAADLCSLAGTFGEPDVSHSRLLARY
jgi:hypothetical protein